MFALTFAVLTVLLPQATLVARDPNTVTDWYLEDFHSDITVNTDSSLNITETIIANAGLLPDKHGIFRVLPRYYVPEANKKVDLPLSLFSITDETGQVRPFKTITDSATTTWKIGDPDVTVTGQNIYNIHYRYDNTIRFGNPEFDEFYWNLNGSFWEIDTDHYTASIMFPAGISKSNTKLFVYSGDFGATGNELATCFWKQEHLLTCESKRPLAPGEGITVSVTFPKGIISPYVAPPFDWAAFLISLIPHIGLIFGSLVISLYFWSKYGKDKRTGRPIIAQYEAPDNLEPIMAGALWNNGTPSNAHVTAQIISLATRGYIKLEHIPKPEGLKGLLKSEDTRLIKTEPKKKSTLSTLDTTLIQELFGDEQDILISSLKNTFYTTLAQIQAQAKKDLLDQQLLDTQANAAKNKLGGILAVIFFGMIILQFFGVSMLYFISGVLSVGILLVFNILMPKRTAKGQEYFEHLKGLKLYINTAEKYRQQFFEKEGIFEAVLPYAIMFGLTGLWISKMQALYGKDFANHLPAWYIVANGGSFNPDTFSTQLSNLTSDMATTLASSPSSSGSGGSGGSGGGGGGGGGGGW